MLSTHNYHHLVTLVTLGIFDHDNNGTIDLNEFQQLWHYINQWKGVFDRYDRDRSGNIDAHELFTGNTIYLSIYLSVSMCHLIIVVWNIYLSL